MRAVLDVDVLVSALVSPRGAPGLIVARWSAGDFELVVSPLLLTELDETLARPKLRKRVSESEASRFVVALREAATVQADPEAAPARSDDSDDDYLLALAEQAAAFLVSGDHHVLALSAAMPIRTPRKFLDLLDG